MSMAFPMPMATTYGQPQVTYGAPQPAYGAPQPAYRSPAIPTAHAASPYQAQPLMTFQPQASLQQSQYTVGQPTEILRTDGSWGACTVTEVAPDGDVVVRLAVGGVRRLHNNCVAQRLRATTGTQAQTYAAPPPTYAAPPPTYAAPPPTYAAPQTYAAPHYTPQYDANVEFAQPVQQQVSFYQPQASMVQVPQPQASMVQVGLPTVSSMIAYPQQQQPAVGSMIAAQSVGPGTEFAGPARASTPASDGKKSKSQKKSRKGSKKGSKKKKGCC